MRLYPELNATAFPSGKPGRKLLTATQWEEKFGINFELVFKASISKNKTTAAQILGLYKNNRYITINKIYNAFRIKPNYSGKDKYATITGCNTIEEVFKDMQRTANSREYKPGTTT